MSNYAVFQVKKETGSSGGLTAHIDREKWDADLGKMVRWNPDSVINPERSVLNKDYLLKEGESRSEAICNRIKEAGINRKIRDNAVRAFCVLCTSDNEKMTQIEKDGKLDEWADDCIKFVQGKFGKENVVSASLHMDEKTPHLHITVVPIVMGAAKDRKESKKDVEKRGGKEKRNYNRQEAKARLCCKDMLTSAVLYQCQTDFGTAMGRWGMVRGEVNSKAIHVDPKAWNEHQRIIEEAKAEISELEDTKQKTKKDIERSEEELRTFELFAEKSKIGLKEVKVTLLNLAPEMNSLIKKLNAELNVEKGTFQQHKDWRKERLANIKAILTEWQDSVKQKEGKLNDDTRETCRNIYKFYMQQLNDLKKENSTLRVEKSNLQDELYCIKSRMDLYKKKLDEQDPSALEELKNERDKYKAICVEKERQANDAKNEMDIMCRNLADMLSYPSLKKAWEQVLGIKKNIRNFWNDVEAIINEAKTTVRKISRYEHGHDFSEEEAKTFCKGVLAWIFKNSDTRSHFSITKKEVQGAVKEILENSNFEGTSDSRKNLATIRSYQLADSIDINNANVFLDNLGTALFRIKSGEVSSGGGVAGELTNWDGTKKRNGWGL